MKKRKQLTIFTSSSTAEPSEALIFANKKKAFSIPLSVYSVFVLGFPLVFILLCGFEFLFFGHQESSLAWGRQISFLQETIFLNASHVYLSFFFLLAHPAGWAWVRDNRKIVLRLLVVIFIFIGLHYLVSTSMKTWMLALSLGLRFLSIHHNYAQQKGLWLLQGRKSQNLLWKRRTADYLTISFIVYWIGLHWVHASAPWALAFALIFLLPLVHFLSQACETKKDVIFSMRFLVPFLFPFSTLANYGMSSVHGMEYVWVQQQQEKGFRFPVLRICGLIFFSILLCLLVNYHQGFVHFFGLPSSDESTSTLFPSLVFGFSMGHYFLDHYLYSNRYHLQNAGVRALFRPVSQNREAS